jgi:hypothetical protein
VQIHRRTQSNSKHKLLYLGGATWKYKTMFSPIVIPDSVEDLLFASGMDIISVDYDITDTHETVLPATKELAKDVDYIFGYSYGCIAAVNAVDKNTKGFILLDPSPIPNDKQTRYFQEELFKDLLECDLKSRNTNFSSKPPKFEHESAYDCNLLVVLSEYCYNNNKLNTPEGMFLNSYRNKTVEVINDSSHFVMIEQGRYELVNKIINFINKVENA